MVRPEGVEPPTYWFVASCSIQLSYGRTLQGMQLVKDNGIYRLEQTTSLVIQRGFPEECGAPGRTRTSDPLVRSLTVLFVFNYIFCCRLFSLSNDYAARSEIIELACPYSCPRNFGVSPRHRAQLPR
jgi:hypothetical protein